MIWSSTLGSSILLWVSDTLSRLRFSQDREDKRQNALRVLSDTFAKFREYPVAYLDPEHLERQQIKVDIKTLPLDDVTVGQARNDTAGADLSFFLPLSYETISSVHKLNLESPEIAQIYAEINETTDENSPELFKAGYLSKQMQISFLTYRLEWEVNEAPRNGTKGNSRPLRVVTGWRSSEFSFVEQFLPYLESHTDPKWEPTIYWLKNGVPHIKLCMYNTSRGDPKLLLRTELFTIIAAIATRLTDDKLKQHLIIPTICYILPLHLNYLSLIKC
ncbi:uncharacterized protein BJX67DRAFT_349749 [Aspergillus lucknowensis]|uniref:Uncharacterized protein n=1 Tax=Aspergillus lucknowensis TaxID=176173 RepID=A0ABR4LVI2_9EURO